MSEKKSGKAVIRSGSRYIGDSVVVQEDLLELPDLRKSEKEKSASEKSAGESEGRRGSRYEDKKVPDVLILPEQHRGSRYQDKQPKAQKHSGALGKLEFGQSLMISAIAVASALTVGYCILMFYFMNHFYPGTVIAGADVSRMNVAEAVEAVEASVDDYSLRIGGRDGLETELDSSLIGLEYVEDGKVDEVLKKQMPALWPFMMPAAVRGVHSVTTKYSRDKALEAFKESVFNDPKYHQDPVNAYVGDAPDGMYAVIPANPGNLLNQEKAQRAVLKALDARSRFVSLEMEDCFVNPTILSDNEELRVKAERLNALLGAEVTYDFGDRKEVVDSSVIKEFIVDAGDGTYYIDEDRVYEYVAGLAEKYDTYEGYRKFVTSSGDTVELWGGDYGWLMDQDSTAQILIRAIEKKVKATYEPEYYHTAMSRNANDIGDTYVEVCITKQTMWCYKDGNLVVETPVVTGNPNVEGRGTPSNGVWAIDGKQQNATLVGDDYRQPVDYWIPFNGGVGIHDLQSRGYYGGDIYQYAGSHGCVNTPLDAVILIYDAVSYGVPVVVYD